VNVTFDKVAYRQIRPIHKRIAVIMSVAIAAFVTAVGLQSVAGAFTATFGDDACGHYVAGVMIHDYLAAGVITNPIQFLIRYFEHYPLFGIGHWPPLYYGVEALWMLLFSPSQASVLLLSAAVAASTALLLCLGVGRQQAMAWGLLVAFAYLASPLTQSETDTLMLDGPVTLVCLSAMLAYARFMETDSLRSSALFGLLAAAGLLIKGNAGCLALFPIAAVLIGRRFDLLRKPSFWLPALIVVVLAGPWYYLTWGLTAQGFRYGVGLNYAFNAAISNMRILLWSVGPVILTLALAPMIRVCGRIGTSTYDSKALTLQICAGSLLAAVFVFQLAVPSAIAARYMLPALPPILILAASELERLTVWVYSRRPEWFFRRSSIPRVALLVLVVASFAPFTIQFPNLKDEGFAAAAHAIWKNLYPENPVLLVATDSSGESKAIVELVMQDMNRPSIFAVRGSRFLGGGGYNNQDYKPRFANASAVMAEIDLYKIPLVLFRDAPMQTNWTHLHQIEEARRLFPNRWQLLYADLNRASGIFLFRVTGNDHEKSDTAAIAAISTPRSLAH